MKDFKRGYSIIGSTALDKKSSSQQGYAHIITFPEQPQPVFFEKENLLTSDIPRRGILKEFFGSMDMLQNLHYGSLRGRKLGNAKRWQTLFASAFIFAAALIAIFFEI